MAAPAAPVSPLALHINVAPNLPLKKITAARSAADNGVEYIESQLKHAFDLAEQTRTAVFKLAEKTEPLWNRFTNWWTNLPIPVKPLMDDPKIPSLEDGKTVKEWIQKLNGLNLRREVALKNLQVALNNTDNKVLKSCKEELIANFKAALKIKDLSLKCLHNYYFAAVSSPADDGDEFNSAREELYKLDDLELAVAKSLTTKLDDVMPSNLWPKSSVASVATTPTFKEFFDKHTALGLCVTLGPIPVLIPELFTPFISCSNFPVQLIGGLAGGLSAYAAIKWDKNAKNISKDGLGFLRELFSSFILTYGSNSLFLAPLLGFTARHLGYSNWTANALLYSHAGLFIGTELWTNKDAIFKNTLSFAHITAKKVFETAHSVLVTNGWATSIPSALVTSYFAGWRWGAGVLITGSVLSLFDRLSQIKV